MKKGSNKVRPEVRNANFLEVFVCLVSNIQKFIGAFFGGALLKDFFEMLPNFTIWGFPKKTRPFILGCPRKLVYKWLVNG